MTTNTATNALDALRARRDQRTEDEALRQAFLLSGFSVLEWDAIYYKSYICFRDVFNDGFNNAGIRALARETARTMLFYASSV